MRYSKKYERNPVKDTVCAKLHKMKEKDKIFSQSNQQETNLKNIVN